MQIDDSYESVVYSKFYTRGIAWLIGIAGAWILYEWEKKPRKLHWIGVVILYAIAGFLLASTVFGTQDLYQVKALIYRLNIIRNKDNGLEEKMSCI